MKDVFLDLISQHQGLIHKICKLYRDGKEDRQDLFQEIVYQLWKSYPQFRQESSVTTWMYRVALNTALSSFRKQKPPVSYTDSLPDTEAGYPEEEGQEEQLFRALKHLKDGEKAIVSLFLEDMSYREMAEILGISENNVGVRINRIKSKLKEIIKELSYGS
ncbi:RNA polymerase sigma factor [Pontibacter locisalis]|uniref:RNA polymerase sigma factor n=1 Tax=Pontibacter locisalis TaxID=1719035 RepID=A0ABW5IR43_9BACT